jgi:hypothetical protein
MARFPALVDTLAMVDGRERGVLDHMGREVREAGLIQTTKRGRGSAEMTSLDAAHLILGVYGADGRGAAAAAAERLGAMPTLRLPGMEKPGSQVPGAVAAIQQQTTVAGAVAAVIESGNLLAAQTPRTQGTLPVIGPLYAQSLLGMELEDWPQGIAVLLRIHRPSLEVYLQFAWRGARHIEETTMLFRPAGQAVDGFKALAAVEHQTFVHTRVFAAFHKVLYPDA